MNNDKSAWVYWKNGKGFEPVLIDRTPDTCEYVSGNDVHVSGYNEKNRNIEILHYLKNGIWTGLYKGNIMKK